MSKILTAYFGELEFLESAVFRFPRGLPGFEGERAFLFVNQPQNNPLMFLQSIQDPKLCFVLLPILVADPAYRLQLEIEDMLTLHLSPQRQPRIGEEVLCAAILRASESAAESPTANLLAPIVVNIKEQIGVQAIQVESQYSHRHPIQQGQEMVSC